MLKSIDWKWLIIGLAIGYFLHVGCTHPKSPLSGAFNMFYGTAG